MNVLIEFDSLFLVGKESSQVAFVHSALSRLRPTAETETEVVRKHGGTGVGARGRIEMRALALRRTYGRGRTDGLAQSFSSIGFPSVPLSPRRRRAASYRQRQWRYRG